MSERTAGARLETVIIFAEQMEKLAAFYAEGLEIGPFEELPKHRGCQIGPVYFGFDQVEEPAQQNRSGVTIWFTVDDLNTTYERLLRLGAISVSPPIDKPWGATRQRSKDCPQLRCLYEFAPISSCKLA